MNRLDPTKYRHFIVTGVLVIHGEALEVFESCHADDLPPGDAGKTELAERVRKHLAAQENDPGASWQSVEVQEFDPPAEMYEGPSGW